MFGFLKKWLGGVSGPAPLSPQDAPALTGAGAVLLEHPVSPSSGYLAVRYGES